MLLKISILFSILSIGCLIAAYLTSWYYIQVKGNILGFTSTITYTFKWREVIAKAPGSDSHSESYDDANLHHVRDMYRIILILVAVGGGCQVILLALNLTRVLIKKLKSNVIRIIAFILSIGSVVVMSFGFFWQLNLPNSFQKDEWPFCGTPDYDKYNCHKLMGKYKDSTTQYTYRPDVGWWIMIGAIVFATGSMLNTMRSRRSIPS